MTKSFAVIAGGRDRQDRIALSLVHRRERIDVALAQVLSIKVVPDVTFGAPDGTLRTYAKPSVHIGLAPSICARLYRLTSAILEETMDIVVGGEVVSSPRVLEPLGREQGICIGVYDVADADALAAKLRRGWVAPQLRVV